MSELFIKNFSAGKPTNDRDGFLGCLIEINEPIYITDLGRYVSGSPVGAHPHTIKLVSQATLATVCSKIVDTGGAHATTVYDALDAPAFVEPGRYYLLSGETSDPSYNDDPFSDSDCIVTAFDGVASILGGAFTPDSVDYYPSRAGDGHSFGPVSFKFTRVESSAASRLVESWSVGDGVLHNDSTQTSGMLFETKTKHLRVSALKRWALAGSNQSHVLRLYEYWTGQQIATATVNLAGWSADGWAEAPITPIILEPYRQYALTCEEHDGGDQFYTGVGASVTTRTLLGDDVAQVQFSVVKLGGTGTAFDGYNAGSLCFGPLDLAIEIVPAPRFLLPRVSAGVVSLESDVVEDATSYRFERSDSPSGTFAPVGTSEANTLTDDAAIGETNFFYRAVPVFEDGSEGLPSLIAKARVRRAQTADGELASSLTRVKSGKLARFTFDGDLPTTPTGAFSIDSTHPSLVAFAPARKEATMATDLTVEGVTRQVTEIRNGDVWYIYYDGGLDADAAVSAHDTRTWAKQHLQASTDRGLTWQKYSYTDLFSRRKDDFGEQIGHALGCVQKFGTKWVMTILRGVAGDPLLTSGPFGGSQFESDSPFGPWKWVRDISDTEYGSFVAKDGSTYYLFGADLAALDVKLSTGASPTGPWSASVVAIPSGIKGRPENPKVFYHPLLNRWIMLVNQIEMTTGSFTDRNSIFVSASPSDWSATQRYDIQHVCDLDARGAIGVMTHVQTAEGLPIFEDNGSLPATFDGNASNGNERFRTGYHGVLEASPKALAFNEGSGVESAYAIALNHADSVFEFACEFDSSSSGYLAFDFRSDGLGNGYRVKIATGAKLKIQKLVGGVATDLASGAGGEDVSTGYLVHRIRIVCRGSNITATLNGTTQATAQDSTYSSGSKVGFAAKSCAGRVRLLSVYQDSIITVKNVRAGSRVVLRGAGDVPMAVAYCAPDESEVQIGFPHSPLKSVQVEDKELVPSDGVWGGDVYELS